MTDWNTWARIVDAAQDPRHRDAVQQFLAQAELSADIPAALDEKFLAPGRSAGATPEECAYVLCNLGFAALVSGSKASAEFAIGCGTLVKQLAPDSPDLVLRRHFLFTKSMLIAAVSTGQPHVTWDDAAANCTAYLSAIDKHLESLPAEAVESNAMAAYSFSAQLLNRIDQNRAVGEFAHDVGPLVDIAMPLAKRLPPAFASRMWASVIPGTDASLYFLRIGAMAQCALQLGDESSDHARKGIAYADEVLSRSQAGPDHVQAMRTRAELLLMSGRYDQAMEQAEALGKQSDLTCQAAASVVKARHDLLLGNPAAAADLLASLAPSADRALEHWRDAWQGETGDNHWTTQSGGFPAAEIDQEIWRLQAVAAVELEDMPGFLTAANLSTGFLADSLLQGKSGWAERTARRAEVVPVEPMVALDDAFSRLDDGTALLQLVSTGAGIVTWVARKREGSISLEIAPGRPNRHKLSDAHGTWSRACFDRWRSDSGTGISKVDCADTFSGLMEEVRRNWGVLLAGLVDDGVSQFVFVGDDLVDIPLHAARIGPGDELLIDRVPVTYAPSLLTLRACTARKPIASDRQRGLELHYVAAENSDSVEALAETLESDSIRMVDVSDPSVWEKAAAAAVFHVDARTNHNARMPLQSVLGAGWLDLSIARIVAGLDLQRCELVSSFACESVLPSMLRAPGLDLASVFLAAGARSVLASTWHANDGLAAHMTRSFFRQWMTGLAPSVAFREAIREMRTERPSLKDIEWACMRLVGAP